MTDVLGVVLAGGRSSRFGSDKAMAEWRGKTLIDHALASLVPFTAAQVVCGRAHAGVLGLSDRPAPGLGPLGGLAAALHHAERMAFARVVCVGCDTPSIPPQLLDELSRATDPVYLAGLPIVSAWPASLSVALDRWIATDTKRSMRGWAAHTNARAVEAALPVNVNWPEDLARLCSDAT